MQATKERIATILLIVVLGILPVAAVYQVHVLRGAARAEATRIERVAATASRQIRNEILLELSGIFALSRSGADAEALSITWSELAADTDIVASVEFVERTDVAVKEGTIYVAGDEVVAVQLDTDVIVNSYIPDLVEAHLGPAGPEFQSALYDATDKQIVYSTIEVAAASFELPGAEPSSSGSAPRIVPLEYVPLTPFPALATRPFILDGDRPAAVSFRDFAQELVELRGLPVEARSQGVAAREIQQPREGLHLVIWHSRGTIERAANAQFVRDLAVSGVVLLLFGVFTVIFYRLYVRAVRQQRKELEFVASVTHELRTPLAAMYAAAENLAEGVVADTGRVKEYGASLLHEGKRLKGMIDQTLRYAGLHGSNLVVSGSVDLRTVVTAITARPAVNTGSLHVRLPKPEIILRGDPDALQSVLGNLVDNAFLHNGADVQVTIDAARSDDRRFATIVVRDDGHGISRADLARATEAFYRGARSREQQVPGTGLGLNIAERIARAHGGQLSIESTPGEGTSVTVILPVVADE